MKGIRIAVPIVLLLWVPEEVLGGHKVVYATGPESTPRLTIAQMNSFVQSCLEVGFRYSRGFWYIHNESGCQHQSIPDRMVYWDPRVPQPPDTNTEWALVPFQIGDLELEFSNGWNERDILPFLLFDAVRQILFAPSDDTWSEVNFPSTVRVKMIFGG